MKNKNNIFTVVFVALLLTALWFYIYQDLSENQENQVNEASSATTSASSLIDGVSLGFDGDGEAIIEVMGVDNLQNLPEEQQKPAIIRPIPDLDREIVFKDDFPEEARQKMIDKIEKASQELKDDPTSFGNWLYLGLDRKGIDDYEGAKQAWEYATLINSDNFVVRGNLGDLYAYYLKDNQKAEENYLKALELGPGQVYLYYKTAEFYQLFLKDEQKARDIVQTGLKLNPNSADLQSLFNNLTTD